MTRSAGAAMVIAMLLALDAACSRQASEPPAQVAAASPAPHVHTAPHGGLLVELGEEFAHVELVLERSTGSLTAYVLDGEAEQPIRLAQPALTVVLDTPASLARRPLALAARANVLTGETVGNSSEFTATEPALRGVTRLRGRILTITVKGAEIRDALFDGNVQSP